MEYEQERSGWGVRTCVLRGKPLRQYMPHGRQSSYFGFLVTAPNSYLFSDDQPYIPPTRPYELSELARDLVLLARYMLKPRGRLVFFLPTVTEEYKEVDVEAMLCEGMELVANSLQDFGSWGRRVSPSLTSTASD